MKTLTLLVGLPASGKSTLRDRLRCGMTSVVLSTDDIIEEVAREKGMTYDEVFDENIQWAQDRFELMFHRACLDGHDIVIDRTNVGVKSRRKLLVPAISLGYQANAIIFERPMTRLQHDEWNRRLASRPGKNIPNFVLVEMFRSFKEPTHDEGFEDITSINTFL